jgi:hypothetical protein
VLAAMPATDPTKSDVVRDIRTMAGRISPLAARRLREKLLRLQLSLITQMMTEGVSVPLVTAVAHTATAISAVELLSGNLRARS